MTEELEDTVTIKLKRSDMAKGGRNRWKGVSKEDRSRIMREASLARWRKKKKKEKKDDPKPE